MENEENILECYRNSDFDERLHLFLQYRSLRTGFIEIETKAMLAEHSSAKTLKTEIFKIFKDIFNSVQKRILNCNYPDPNNHKRRRQKAKLID